MPNIERLDGAENSEKAKSAKGGSIEIKFLNVLDKRMGTLDIKGVIPYSEITKFLQDHGAGEDILGTVSQIREDIRRFTKEGVLIDTEGKIGEAAESSTRHKFNITPRNFSNLTYELKGSSRKSIAFYTSGRLANGYVRAFDAYATRLLKGQTMPDDYDVRAHELVKQILVEIAEEQKEVKLVGVEKK